MKKIFYFIASAIVALGAVACQNDVDETINPESKGVSFYAEVEGLSRITIGVQDENGYPVIWEVGDKLEVNTNEKIYFFEYDGEKFTCYDEGVENIVGKNVLIIYASSIYGLDSTLGKSGLYLSTGHEIVFSPDMTIKLEVVGSFLRFASEHSVTLSMESEQAYEAPFIYNGYHNSITLEAGDDIWVPFYIDTPTPPHCEYTLSASIDGEVIKSTTVKLEQGKIYNLGTIVKPSKTYLVPNMWAEAGAKFAAYFFNDDAETASLMATRAATEVWVWMTDEDNDGTYECNIPEGFANVIFCRMNPTAETPSWESVWNQTANLTIKVEKTYYVTDWKENEESNNAKGLWEDATAGWTLAGTFDDWGAGKAMESVAGTSLFVVEDLTLAANARIKVKHPNTWEVSFGGGIDYLKADHYMMSYINGSDITILEEGTYDIYFDEVTHFIYLMTAGISYVDATEQTTNGNEGSGDVTVTPGEESEWSLFGDWDGSGNWIDKMFVYSSTANLVVAENVTMKAAQGFLVRKPSTEWADKYAAGNINYIQANKYITTAKDGADLCVEAAGTYDIYFDVNTKALYLMTAGVAPTTATEQTANGKEPENEEVEVTENMLYLKPNSNWKQSNARFAAYFWNKSGSNTWVGMVDSDSDGIYEVNIPEGYTFGDSVIFARMNPSTTANNWNNKWNQTADLIIPTDGKNLYTVKDNTWDKGGGAWSVK